MLAEFIKLPKEGDTVGPYLVRKTLSVSILGSFYIATHKGLHEDVLVHIIPEALLRADSRFHGRYKEVIERQKRLPKGPALAAVDMVQISGNMIVQYEGSGYRSLTSVVAQRKEPLSEESIRHYLKSIAVGLSDALKIEQGHFFLTPDFLFLNEDGEIRIAGIGLFQSIQYESFERFVSGAVIPIVVDKSRSFSAIEILSPEIRNFKKRDQRSDFYCVGMCAYFMITGFKPERRWALPSKVRKDLGQGWDLFVSHCLEPKPGDRFPHYRSFMRDLDHIEDLTAEPKREGGQLLRTLSRIPLPQFLENLLSMRSMVFVRLILLGIAGILAVGSAAIMQHIILSDFDISSQERPIQQVFLPERANISLKVNPSQAFVVIKGPESGRFVLRGNELLLHGRSGTYTVTISSPRHRSERLSFELKASEPIQREVALELAFSSLRVSGVVGTEIYVESEPGFPLYLGTIESESGLLIDNRLLQGQYTLLALHPTFQPERTESVRLRKATVEVAFAQVPKPTELIVRSEPDGASVLLDNALVGITPLRIEGLEIGEAIEVRVQKEGFRPFSREVTFALGERLDVDTGNLAPREGQLDVNLVFGIDNPPSREAFTFQLDGKDLIVDQNSLVLPEGKHTLKVAHPDFFPIEETITIPDNEVVRMNIEMEPKPVRLIPQVNTDSPARFEVDDREVALTEEGVLPIPSYQSVEVVAIIRDHLKVIQRFEGKANQEIDWVVPLKPLPGPKFGEDWSPPYFDFLMSWIEPQLFNIGSPIDEYRRLPNEDNFTAVRLTKGFWIGIYEVTQGVYLRVMGDNPSRFEGEQHPVDSVTYNMAKGFCDRLTAFEAAGGRLPEGYVYRLPTEAEWELAARGGTESPFSFGFEADPESGNFSGFYRPGETVGKSPEERYGTLTVGSFEPNPFGLYDVHGNVAEWVLDRFWDRHPGGIVVDPYNADKGRGYVLRGGSWRDSADRVRSAAREAAPAQSSRNSIGFRIVLGPAMGD